MAELKKYQMYIDGAWTDAENGAVFESLNPATALPWALMPEASEADVDRAVMAASRALNSGEWAELTATARGKLLYRLADLLAEHSADLGAVETMDSGKLAKETQSQALYIADYYRYYAGLADKIEGATLPIDKPGMHVHTRREPIGVVAAIVPWNAQMFLTATKLGPALAAGNTVVLKASEGGPAPMLDFARLIEEAGFPPGVVNVISGFGEPCGRALTSHPEVARIAFTGGPEAARHVVRNSAENFAHVTLELGGKSPIMVFDDADLESAVNGIIAGNFGASGQSCVAGSRVMLQAGIHDQIVERLVERAAKIRIGDPLGEDTQMGPLATEAQVLKIETAICETVSAGGELAHGGKRPDGLAGWYFEPTIMVCPNPDLATVRDEMFGPVMSILKFKDETEALKLANDTSYGLGAGVFTRDIARAMRISEGVHSGIVWINTYRVISPMAPFGGFKRSGYGRESGLQAIEDYTLTKTVWINMSDEPMADPFVMR
jgi:(Z)-2-((N-methylformamido)methylene)-5-hydroxybutyrolactone dehydrogenase